VFSNLYMRVCAGVEETRARGALESVPREQCDDLVICGRVGAEQALTADAGDEVEAKLTVNENKTRVVICRRKSLTFWDTRSGVLLDEEGRVYSAPYPKKRVSASVERSATKPDETKSGKIRRQSWTGSIG